MQVRPMTTALDKPLQSVGDCPRYFFFGLAFALEAAGLAADFFAGFLVGMA